MKRKKEMAAHSSTLAWRIPWTEEPGGLLSMGLHNWTQSRWLSMHACIGEGNATHSGIPAWRIPGTEEPGGLPSMGSHRVRHDWNDLAVAAAVDAERWTWRPFRVLSSKAGMIDIRETFSPFVISESCSLLFSVFAEPLWTTCSTWKLWNIQGKHSEQGPHWV